MFRLYQLIWQRFVASQMVPAVFDQTTIDITAGDYTFRASGSVQKFDGYLAVYQMSADDDEDAEADAGKALLPRVTEGETLRLENAASRPAFHRAAAALHRSDAGEGAGRKGHRPAFHLRLDHFDDRRARVRHQGSGTIFAHDARRKSQRAAGEELRGHFRRGVHGAHGRGTRRNRRRKAALEESRQGILRALRGGPGAGQGRNGVLQGGDSHRAKVREVRRGRTARAHQPARLFPGLLALSGLRFHPRLSPELPPEGEDGAAEDRRSATTAGARWSSSAAAGARSWRAPAIPIARRRAA